MLGRVKRGAVTALALFFPLTAFAQQPPQAILSLGSAVVSGFSGTIAPAPGIRTPQGKNPIDLAFIDPEGASAQVIDLSRPGFLWDGRVFNAPKTFTIKAGEVGQVFGIALDDANPPNIYLAATSAYGLNIVARARDGSLERRKKGGPGSAWMKGQFGLDLGGGPGAIYRIDGASGQPSLFANVTLDGVPNPAPALGNLAYDPVHKQLFVADLYTGMIHRFDLTGNDLGRYDHGVTGLSVARLPTVAFDPKRRANIANAVFDTEKPETWEPSPAARRVFGLAVHQGRLYYSVASGPQIWSIGLTREGAFAADPRWEADIPAQAGALPVTDIAFSQKGAMILAQRALQAASYDYSAFTRPGEPRVFRLWLKGPNDPPSPGRWKLEPEEYAIGFADTFRNTNGGIALGYGYDQNGLITSSGCEFSLWSTGQNLRNAPPLRSQLEPGGPLVVHGLMGVPASPVREVNTPPWVSYAVAYGDKAGDPRAAGHMGGIRIHTKPCAPPAVYSGPGYVTPPPYIVTVVQLPGCVGRGCVPPPICVGPSCQPDKLVDIAINKDGATTPAQQPYYSFTMEITNNGAAFTGVNNITVTDVLPAGMTFNTVIAAPAGDWSCPASVPAGGTLSCIYTGSGPVGSGVIGTLTISATAGGSAPYPPVQNCATVAVSGGYTDTNAENDKSCVTVAKKDPTGELIIVKKVVNNGPMPVANLTYTTTVTCGGWSKTFNLIDNVPQSTGGVPQVSCSVTETLPPAPASACAPNQTATWQTPSITPSNPFTPSGITTTVTVTNTLNCKPQADPIVGILQIVKTVQNDTEADISGLNFAATVNCSGALHSLNLTTASPQAVPNVSAGSVCSVSEAVPPPPSTGCVTGLYPAWEPAAVSPATVSITAGATVTITVANKLRCERGGYIAVTKNVINNTQADLSGLIFPVTLTCIGGGSPSSRNVSLTAGGTQLAHNVVIGMICTPSETLPAAPAGGCPAGQAPAWGAPVYTPATVTSVAGAGPTLTVQNTLNCVPVAAPKQPMTVPPVISPSDRKLVCRSPLVANSAGTACVCDPGLVRRGKECLARVVCAAPAYANPHGTSCLCPQGMVLRGSTCVRREREGPRIRTEDVIRAVPGIVPGFGIGGAGGVSRSGGDKGGYSGGAGGPAGVR